MEFMAEQYLWLSIEIRCKIDDQALSNLLLHCSITALKHVQEQIDDFDIKWF